MLFILLLITPSLFTSINQKQLSWTETLVCLLSDGCGLSYRWRCGEISHLDEVHYELVLLFGCGHLIVSDGFPQCLLGNEGIQVEDRGQPTVQTDELFFVGVEMN